MLFKFKHPVWIPKVYRSHNILVQSLTIVIKWTATGAHFGNAADSALSKTIAGAGGMSAGLIRMTGHASAKPVSLRTTASSVHVASSDSITAPAGARATEIQSKCGRVVLNTGHTHIAGACAKLMLLLAGEQGESTRTAHALAKEEVGQAGVPLGCECKDGEQVLHVVGKAVGVAWQAVDQTAQPVAAVVKRHDDKACAAILQCVEIAVHRQCSLLTSHMHVFGARAQIAYSVRSAVAICRSHGHLPVTVTKRRP